MGSEASSLASWLASRYGTRPDYLDRRNCHDCGHYVPRSRMTSSKWVKNVYPLCKECGLKVDPSGRTVGVVEESPW